MIDGSAPAELERLLEAAVVDPAERPAFINALYASDVLVIGDSGGRMVRGIAPGDTPMRLLFGEDEEGVMITFFTSEAAVAATAAARPETDARPLAVSCRKLFESTRPLRLVLNPNGPNGKVFAAEEIDALLAGRPFGLEREEVTTERRVIIGQPENIEPGLEATLARFFVQRPAAESVRLGWLVHPDSSAGYVLIVVSADADGAVDGLGAVATPEVTGGESLDVIVMPPGSTDQVLTDIPPFYVRPPQTDIPPADSPDSTDSPG